MDPLTKVGHFNSSAQDSIIRLKNNQKYFFHKYTVTVSIPQYIQFFLLHIIYYGIFGPLIAIPALCSKNLSNLFSNLQITKLGVSFYAQTFYWICALLLYYAFFDKMMIADFSLLHIWVIALILRSMTIAGKYATYQKIQIQRYFKEKLTIQQLIGELMFYNWLAQKTPIIETELKNSFMRKDIDRRLLKAAFMEKLEGETKKEFDQIINDIQSKGEEMKAKVVKDAELGDKATLEYYDSTLVFHFLTRAYNRIFPIKGYQYFLLFLTSFLYGLSPALIRVFRGKKFHGEETLEIIIFYFTAFGYCFLIFTAAGFYRLAMRDINNKRFILRNLGQLISPRNDPKISNQKLLPSFNIVDKLSVSAWLNLRTIGLDYGKKFHKRHELFVSVAFLIGLSAIVYAFSIHYYASIFDQEITQELEDLTYCLLIDFFLMSLMFLRLIHGAAKVNGEFSVHIQIVKKNKELLKRFSNNIEFYFGSQNRVAKGEVGLSFLQERLTEEIKSLKGEKTVEDFLAELIGLYENCARSLQDEMKYGSVRVLGAGVGMGYVCISFVGILILGFLSIEILVFK